MTIRLNKIIVVGANLAGLRAAETLRHEGYDGSIILVNGEKDLPYDRPPLSKQALTGKLSLSELTFHDESYYDDLGVDIRNNTRATALDLDSGNVALNGSPADFDGLIIATGATARTLPIFDDWDGVHVMRDINDARKIRAAFEGNPRVVVIGAGFIGSEVAASARDLGLDVTMLEALATPLVRAVGPELGAACARLHQDNGTDLRCNVRVTNVEGNDRVERLRLSDGSTIDADLVVVGIGVTPNVEWLARSGLTIDDGLVCDEKLNAGHPAVFAAGDVTWWPNPLFGIGMRCEHWTNSIEQGRRAARNLLPGHDNGEPYRGPCYFWSDQYDIRIQSIGIQGDEMEVVDGSLHDHSFAVFFRREDRIVGAMSMNSPKFITMAKRLIEKNQSWNQALSEL